MCPILDICGLIHGIAGGDTVLITFAAFPIRIINWLNYCSISILTIINHGQKFAAMTKKMDLHERMEEALELFEKGKFSDAEHILTECEEKAKNARFFHLLGLTQRETGKFEKAKRSFFNAIKLDSRNAKYFVELGILYYKLNSPNDARFYFAEATSIDEKCFDAYLNLAILERNANNYDSALNNFMQARAIRPNDFLVNYNIGHIHYLRQNYNESLKYLLPLLEREKDNAELFFLTGSNYLKLKEFEKALEKFQKAVELDENYRYYANLGVTNYYLGNFLSAKKMLQKSLEKNPENNDAKLNLAAVLALTGEFDKALELYDEIIANDSGDSTAKFNKATLLLKTGRYEEGLRFYEYRLTEAQLSVLPKIPFWRGEDLTNKKIIVLDEQGAGDSIQFVRYLKLLKEKGAYVILQTKETLYSLFSDSSLADEIIYGQKTDVEADYKIYLLSLPKVTKKFPYKAEKYIRGKKDVYLPFEQSSEIKAGIVWRGNKKNIYDKLRSFRLEDFTELLEIPGVLFYSFQIDADEKEKQVLKSYGVIDLSPKIETFSDSAGFAEKLDLIISVDTAFAHLGGALGKPTWIIIGEHDWRWGTERNKTEWYESVTLFRKKNNETRDEIIGKTALKLRNLVNTLKNKNALLLKYNAIRELNSGNLDKAENILNAYIKATDDFEGYYWLGFLKLTQEKLNEAQKYLENSLEKNPRHSDTIKRLGELALKKRDFKSAEKYLSKIIKETREAELCNLYGFVLFKLKKFDEADEFFRKAISIEKKAGYYMNAGNNAFEAGEFEKALQYYDVAIELENLSGAHVGKGMLLLSKGDFKQGFAEFLWSLEKKKVPAEVGKKWKGESLKGKEIVIYTEQGLGDSINFLRFASRLKEEGAVVKIVCPKQLKELFASSKYVDEVRTDWYLHFDYYASILELPVILGVENKKDFAMPADLFGLDKNKIKEYKLSLDSKKTNVALVWKTYSKAETAGERSVSEAEIKKLFELENVNFFIPQIDTPPEIEKEITEKFDNVKFIKKELYDLAHFLKAVDLVVAIDSVVLHLAGSVNAETLALIKKFPDWRWEFEGESSFIYPSVKIIRQSCYGNWEKPLSEVATVIKEVTRKKQTMNEGDEERWFSSVDEVNKLVEKFLSKGKPAVAREILEEAMAFFDFDENLIFKSGYVNQLVGELDTAIYYYLKTLHRNPLNVDALNNVGVALKDKGEFKKAERFLEISLSVNPDNISALNNLGLIKELNGNFEEAVKYYDKALKAAPEFKDAILNKANALMFLYRFEESLKTLDKILELEPENIGANYNKAVINLFMGNYETGFKYYEWRRRRPEYVQRNFTKPQLETTDVNGKRVLIYDEQGYGDTIQFFRFVKKMKDAGATVILETHANLSSLFSNSKFVDFAVPRSSLGDPENVDYDFHIPLLSLPAFFGIKNENDLSDMFPYIDIDMNLKEKYGKMIFKGKKRKVGLVWEGKKPVYNEHRSTTLVNLRPLTEEFDFDFYSLQQKNVAEKNKEEMSELGIVDLSEHLDNFNHTAAIVANLDFVITIDTSIAHLSGALNKPTFVLLSRKADWRWGTGEKTPWYGSHVLIRQNRLGEWKQVIEDLINKINSFETDFKLIN